MSEKLDWDPIRGLAPRVLRHGAPLELTDDVRALLLCTARDVAIRDAASALKSDAGALELLSECSRRIHDGSVRLMRALHRMYRHQEAGDFESARQEMRNVLGVEVVPLCRTLGLRPRIWRLALARPPPGLLGFATAWACCRRARVAGKGQAPQGEALPGVQRVALLDQPSARVRSTPFGITARPDACRERAGQRGGQQLRREPCRPQGVTRPPISGKRS